MPTNIIIEKKIKKLNELSSSRAKNKEGQLIFNKQDKFKAERIKFVEYCLEQRITYEQIACMLGISKGRVYQIAHYREDGILTAWERKAVKKRDGDMCSICGIDKKLHIHHIFNSYEKNGNNLITLCSSHHSRLHKNKLTKEEMEKFNSIVGKIKNQTICIPYNSSRWESCEICDDTGEVRITETENRGGEIIDAQYRKCECQIEEPNDFSGAGGEDEDR